MTHVFLTNTSPSKLCVNSTAPINDTGSMTTEENTPSTTRLVEKLSNTTYDALGTNPKSESKITWSSPASDRSPKIFS